MADPWQITINFESHASAQSCTYTPSTTSITFADVITAAMTANNITYDSGYVTKHVYIDSSHQQPAQLNHQIAMYGQAGASTLYVVAGLEHDVNKVVFGTETLIDLTTDTVQANKVLTGYTAHVASGAVVTGTCSYDANTQDANATGDDILSTKTAYVRGNKITGTMPNIGTQTNTISAKEQSVSISQGYHDGSGTVEISSVEQAKIIANNIREGVVILGVTGTMSGSEGVVAQAKTITPTIAGMTVLPDTGYTHLSQVTVNAIPRVDVLNSAGGVTVTIG